MRFLILLVLIACNQTTPTDSNVGNEPAPGGVDGWGFPISTAQVQYAFQDLSYSFSPISDLVGTGWSVSVTNKPAWLSAAVAGSEVQLSGQPNETEKSYSVVVNAAKGSATRSASFTLHVRGDKLRGYQWHLNNDGNRVFSRDPGTAGEDLDAASAWKKSLGSGVKVAVSDTGLEITHGDLKNNLLEGEHRNYVNGTSSTGWVGNPSTYGGGHGTAVSGIIAAQGWNNIGVTGVAPMARLAGFQFLESNQTSAQYVHQASGDFDIFNYSYGSGLNADLDDDPLFIAQLRDRVTNGRNGLGQIFVKAGGNEYDYFCDTLPGYSGEMCLPQNANIPAENNSPFMILVGASNAVGRRSSYSSAGSGIWVVAPGGEYGDSKPAIISTDLAGCSAGFSNSTAGPFMWNKFETYSATDAFFKTWNPSCDYTSTMNGSSSATPAVSGVVALMLAVNPQLSWRDVKHILATTSERIHSAHGSSDHPVAQMRLAGYVYEQGWVQNAAGHYFHNWYGFGRVNAAAAVTRALDPSFVSLPAWFESNPDFDDAQSGLNVTIPDGSSVGVSRAMSMNLGATKIVETVQLRLEVEHQLSGQVGVELTSPSGTKSILLNINNALSLPVGNSPNPDQDLQVVLSSHAFYGEPTDGNWTLKLIDGVNDNKAGKLRSWSINILGH